MKLELLREAFELTAGRVHAVVMRPPASSVADSSGISSREPEKGEGFFHVFALG